MTDRLVLVSTSPRVAPGVLTLAAWEALRSGPVWCADPAHPQLPALTAAGIEVSVLPGAQVTGGDAALAAAFRARAAGGTAVWLAGSDGDPGFARALGTLVAREGGRAVELEAVAGSYDLPGARLLDAVAVMDRLCSPGGCPWDVEQTHASLAPYLLEEAYEAYEALEDGDLDALREELGDVLLQILFHARIARDEPGAGWDADGVAAGLVDKLVRRHPHVFGTVEVGGPADVEANWAVIKAEEKRRTSATDGVPLGQPALSLAAQLQRRAEAAGVPVDLTARQLAAAPTPAHAVAAAAGELLDSDVPPTVDRVGELLFAAVALAREAGVDPEAALRGTARRLRTQLAATEAAARAAGRDPRKLDEPGWRELWVAEQGGDADPT